MAIDPLSYYVEVLTVAVFDSATFDAIFPKIVERNDEGRVQSGRDGRGIPFTEPGVRSRIQDPKMAPAGAACLQLASQHRERLLTAPTTVTV